MIKGIRGFAQGFVRAAVAIGERASEAYSSLRQIGLDYARGDFEIDWDIYNEQTGFTQLAMEMDPDQLIMGHLHGESIWNLSEKYRYEVTTPYMTPDGILSEQTVTVTSKTRLTMQEVFDQGDELMETSPPVEGVEYGEKELSGIWYRD